MAGMPWRVVAMVTVAMVLSQAQASHFRGGTISWKSLGGRKVEFYFKLGWSLSSSLSPGCKAATVKTLIKSSSPSYWKCTRGCPMANKQLAKTEYICSGINVKENWEQGENTFTHTFTNDGPITVSYSDGSWINLSNGKGSGDWNIETTVNLGKRSDTGIINSSPVSLSKPVYKTNFNCDVQLRIPIVDADGDNIGCTFASGNECKSICNALPGAVLDEDTCTITFSTTVAKGYIQGGVYAVSLTIRDYPKIPMTMGAAAKTPSDALSSIPIQFLINTIPRTGSCDAGPQFVPPSPKEKEVVTAEEGDKVIVDLYADNGNDTSVKVTTIIATGVLRMTSSAVSPVGTRTNTFKTTLTWQTAVTKDVGNHLVCGSVTNAIGLSGSDRCFTITIVPKGCRSMPCQNGAKCISNKGTYKCICRPGFTGHNCEINIDDCPPNRCKNGGTCVDGITSFKCHCVPGFTGKECETDIDECQSNPCLNGGNCTEGINNYTCTCPLGFSGRNCNIRNYCIPDPCKNNASCVDFGNKYSCVCQPGYTGKTCQTDIDECQSNPCLNGGNCTEGINNYTCTCPLGFSGRNCNIRNYCIPDPCKNNASCVDFGNKYSCVCQPGYTGKTCQTDIDECQSNPCLNGGNCTEGINNYTCTCPLGFSGRNCNIRNHCIPDPCKNSVTCADLGNKFYCVCQPGYKGKTCQTDIDECAGNPCLNGAKCLNQKAKFSCVCTPGYSGTLCQTGHNYCKTNPCRPRLCINGRAGYSCKCPKGWTGKSCTIVDPHHTPPPVTTTTTTNKATTTTTTTATASTPPASLIYGTAMIANNNFGFTRLGLPPNKTTIRATSSTVTPTAVIATQTSPSGRSSVVTVGKEMTKYLMSYQDCDCMFGPTRNDGMSRTIRDILAFFYGFPMGLACVTRCGKDDKIYHPRPKPEDSPRADSPDLSSSVNSPSPRDTDRLFKRDRNFFFPK